MFPHSYQQGVEGELHVPAARQVDVVHQQQARVHLHEDGQQLQDTGGNMKCPQSDVNTDHIDRDIWTAPWWLTGVKFITPPMLADRTGLRTDPVHEPAPQSSVL